jgi:hypothetical protein
MLHLDLWGRNAEHVSLRTSLARLWGHEAIRFELAEVLDALAAQTTALVMEDRFALEPRSARPLHPRRSACGARGGNPERPPTMREGVVWAKDAKADVFFVTLRKSEKTFSVTTMYHDYAISSREFHWESQSTTSIGSPPGSVTLIMLSVVAACSSSPATWQISATFCISDPLGMFATLVIGRSPSPGDSIGNFHRCSSLRHVR